MQRLHVHRASCSVDLRLPKAHVFSFLLGQIVRGEPGLLCDGRSAAASATRQVRLQQRNKPCDKQKLVKQSSVHSTSSAWRQSGACSVGHVVAGECFSPKTEGGCPPSQKALSVRLTPTAATSIVMSMSETQRSRGNPSVPETPSRHPLQNSPTSARPDLRAFVGIWKKSRKASARCTSMATNRHARL